MALSVRRNFPSSRSAFHRVVLGASIAAPGAAVPVALDPSDASQRDETLDLPEGELPTRLALVSTIQFVAAIQSLREDLSIALPPLEKEEGEDEGDGAIMKPKKRDVGVWRGKYEVTIPQSRPLSPGEVLGCTAPKLDEMDALM